MSSTKKNFNKIVDRINVVSITIAEISLVGLLILTAYSSITRYFFRSPSIYSTEISLYLVLVSTWLAAGFIHQEGRHVSVEFFSNSFGKWLKLFSKLVSNISIILFCLILIWAGFMVAETAFIRDYRSSTMLRFPLWITYSLIPIGGFLLTITAIKRLVNPDEKVEEDQSSNKESI